MRNFWIIYEIALCHVMINVYIYKQLLDLILYMVHMDLPNGMNII